MLEIILLFFALAVGYIAYKMILAPLLLIQYYKKQGGGHLIYSFGLGIDDIGRKNIKAHGDYFYEQKKLIKQNPNLNFIGGNLGTYTELTLTQPFLIKDFLMNQEKYYRKSPIYKGFTCEIVRNGLVFSEGEQWKKHRKVVSSVFHFEFLKEMIPMIVETANEFFDELSNRKSEDESIKDANIMEEFQRITGEVVIRIFFGNTVAGVKMNGKPITTELSQMMTEMMKYSYSFSGILLGEDFLKLGLFHSHRELLKRMRNFKKFCRKIVDKRKEQFMNEQVSGIQEKPRRKDLLDALFEFQLKNPENAFSSDEIIDEFITFFVAGMDTSGHTLTMASYYLNQFPEWKTYIRNEVETLFPKDKNPTLTQEILNEMTFTNAVIKETLRIASPAPQILQRVAIADHKLGSVLHIKKGTMVVAGFYAVNQNEKYYDHPEKFDPTRWLEGSHRNPEKSDSFTFTPFSGGPRNCIGQHLALNMLKIILGLFLRRFEYEIPKDYKLNMAFYLLYEPEEPIKCTLSDYTLY